ncbi:MAG TPA: VanW family protein [Anaerolineaceae bacterium]
MSSIAFPAENQKSSLTQALQAVLIGGLLFCIGLVVTVVAFETAFAGHIYPGVSVAGVDLSGMTPPEAAARIAENVSYPQSGRILLYDNTSTFTTSPAGLGFFVDPETSAMSAYRLGRSGNVFQNLANQSTAWFEGMSLAPTLVFDQRVAQQYLLSIARQINKPVIEANLGLNGAQVVVHSGQVGREMDTGAALALVTTQLASLRDGAIRLPVKETAPVILDAQAQAALARTILSAPLSLTIANPSQGDPGPWSFDPQALANMLAVERVQNGSTASYQVALDTTTLRDYLTKLAPTLERQPKMPRMNYNDSTHQLEVVDHAVIGRSLDVDASIQAIDQKLNQGEHTIPLVFKETAPAVTDTSTAEQLGIQGLVHTETSYFYGSAASRVQNITTAAAQFNGVLVAPGEVFSMADTLGDISLDNGYAEALIILGNQTIKGVGGGVCQVSTTLFRAAFFSGFPIVERHAHAYRVTYYEKTAGNRIDPNLAGLDATVFVPLVDMKFKNDTPAWLLMETNVNPSASTITWRFYSTPNGRKVDYNTTGLTHITQPPPPIYRENPDLAKGKIKQVDWAVQGADVTVNRTVTKDGQVYLQDTFYTHFQPWRDIFEYGPGTEGIPTQTPSQDTTATSAP